MHPVEIKRGKGPIILGMPHTGTFVPDDVMDRLNDQGRKLTDTDWHIDQLYDGLLDDVTIVRATFSRYVIDANRDPKGVSLYPGQNTTTLCPTTDFEGEPIYFAGEEPTKGEVEERRMHFHAPYHQALADEIARLKQLHADVVLYDCHSIRSILPFLFEGTLPDLNLGTNEGTTCAPEIEQQALQICARSGFETVLNGRFKGGWTTRHYADPNHGVHAFQMETAQSAYLTNEQAPWTYDETKANKLRPVLKTILTMMTDFCAANART
ncbi:N-formylglutamate deformylase [Maritalea porphyrae]|uniref:N-formylglutamate deformylase n=1 Tax=Maritalea porphyrae TaxID=880732 RepID=UPI0022AF8B9F|nr:N-formylglutamate deformylase [Maritalea porphyrae]MCZ4272132.1 N-formylglutamate deformylase [Maritalea porphyrae]